MFRSVFLMCCMLCSSVSYAEDAGKFATLATNEPAPFEGVLFDPIATAHILSQAELFQAECELEIEYRLDIQSTEFNLERQELRLRLESLTDEYTLLVMQKDIEIEELQKAIKSQSPRNNWVWGVVGVAIGGIAVYALTNENR